MSFSQQICLDPQIQNLLAGIHAHPFNVELARGTLDPGKFHFYLAQDSLYLIEFAKALALTAARLDSADEIQAFLDFARGALVAERELHQHFLGGSELGAAAPSNLAYTGYLLSRCQTRDVAVAMAALLPCFWVYREVGRRILERHVSPNPYARWIETYASPEFSAVVDRALAFVDRVADRSSPVVRREMAEAFAASCRLEWMFWDAAYAGEVWPPASA